MSTALPCIRCGYCAEACPIRLQPQLLYWHLQGGHLDRARNDGIDACIECRRCDEVCPSHIPLADGFHRGKQAAASRALLAERAQAARQRFEVRASRLQRESDQRVELESVRKTAMAAPDAVAAALARARAKRDTGKGDQGG